MGVSKRKLRSRLMAVVISILSCFAVMSVGVYAASRSFAVTVENQVELELMRVDGGLWAKRLGNVVYNGDEHTDEALANQKSAVINDYLKVYDYLDSENDEYAKNLAEIEKRVNIEETKDNVDEDGNLRILYFFKYELVSSSVEDVLVTLTESSTKFKDGDMRSEFVQLNYRFMFSSVEPDWVTDRNLGTAFAFTNDISTIYIDNGTAVQSPSGQYAKIDPTDPEMLTLFIFAELVVKTTSSLDETFTLGVQDDFFWTFSLKFTNV